MRVKAYAGIEQALFVSVLILKDNGTCKNAVNKRIAGFSRINYSNIFRRIEASDDFLTRIVAKRTQENSAEDFLFAVNFCKNQFFFLVNFKFKPGTAVRNYAAGIHALVVLENNSRRAVNLRNNDALCTVDDERSAVCHKRNIAHINVLLNDMTVIQERKINTGFQRNRIGQTFLLAFEFRKFNVRIIEFVIFKLKGHIAVRTFNRER